LKFSLFIFEFELGLPFTRDPPGWFTCVVRPDVRHAQITSMSRVVESWPECCIVRLFKAIKNPKKELLLVPPNSLAIMLCFFVVYVEFVRFGVVDHRQLALGYTRAEMSASRDRS
jgi:hypothetical protein